MRTTDRRPRWRVLLTVLALAGMPALVAVATATPAQARCAGAGQPVTMSLPVNQPNPIAKEIPETGTCNRNLAYTGYVEDSVTDGSCATLIIYDNSAGGFIEDHTECRTGGRTRFEIGHADGLMYFVLIAAGQSAGRNNFGY